MDVLKIAPREQRAVDALLKQYANKTGSTDFRDPEATVFQVKFGEKVMALRQKDLDGPAKLALGKLKESTEQLEGVLVKQMLAVMAKSKPKGELEGPMSDMAQDMMHQSMADQVGRTGQFGMGQVMYQQLAKPILNQRLAQVYLNNNQVKQ